MSFRDNLQHLRSTRNMTQEQLAMLVGVSRQSVTKWEAERAYPEMDKLLKLCQIFDCTLDELVQGDLTGREDDPALAVPDGAVADVAGYDEHHRRYALRMGVGVALIIVGIAASTVADDFGLDGASAMACMLGLAAGLLVMIPAIMEHAAFRKAHPYVSSFYTTEQLIQERRAYGMHLGVGIAVMLASFGFSALTSELAGSDGIMLVGVAAGVGMIVHAVLLGARLNVEAYNDEALEDLSESEIVELYGEEGGAAALARRGRAHRLGVICGIIMLVSTIVGLGLLFGFRGEGRIGQMFWLAWVVGGICCAIVALVDQLRER